MGAHVESINHRLAAAERRLAVLERRLAIRRRAALRTMQADGEELPRRSILNFLSAVVTDNPENGSTDVDMIRDWTLVWYDTLEPVNPGWSSAKWSNYSIGGLSSSADAGAPNEWHYHYITSTAQQITLAPRLSGSPVVYDSLDFWSPWMGLTDTDGRMWDSAGDQSANNGLFAMRLYSAGNFLAQIQVNNGTWANIPDERHHTFTLSTYIETGSGIIETHRLTFDASGIYTLNDADVSFRFRLRAVPNAVTGNTNILLAVYYRSGGAESTVFASELLSASSLTGDYTGETLFNSDGSIMDPGGNDYISGTVDATHRFNWHAWAPQTSDHDRGWAIYTLA